MTSFRNMGYVWTLVPPAFGAQRSSLDTLAVRFYRSGFGRAATPSHIDRLLIAQVWLHALYAAGRHQGVPDDFI